MPPPRIHSDQSLQPPKLLAKSSPGCASTVVFLWVDFLIHSFSSVAYSAASIGKATSFALKLEKSIAYEFVALFLRGRVVKFFPKSAFCLGDPVPKNGGVFEEDLRGIVADELHQSMVITSR